MALLIAGRMIGGSGLANVAAASTSGHAVAMAAILAEAKRL